LHVDNSMLSFLGAGAQVQAGPATSLRLTYSFLGAAQQVQAGLGHFQFTQTAVSALALAAPALAAPALAAPAPAAELLPSAICLRLAALEKQMQNIGVMRCIGAAVLAVNAAMALVECLVGIQLVEMYPAFGKQGTLLVPAAAQCFPCCQASTLALADQCKGAVVALPLPLPAQAGTSGLAQQTAGPAGRSLSAALQCTQWRGVQIGMLAYPYNNYKCINPIIHLSGSSKRAPTQHQAWLLLCIRGTSWAACAPLYVQRLCALV
jgi:hypothetical protein